MNFFKNKKKIRITNFWFLRLINKIFSFIYIILGIGTLFLLIGFKVKSNLLPNFESLKHLNNWIYTTNILIFFLLISYLTFTIVTNVLLFLVLRYYNDQELISFKVILIIFSAISGSFLTFFLIYLINKIATSEQVVRIKSKLFLPYYGGLLSLSSFLVNSLFFIVLLIFHFKDKIMFNFQSKHSIIYYILLFILFFTMFSFFIINSKNYLDLRKKKFFYNLIQFYKAYYFLFFTIVLLLSIVFYILRIIEEIYRLLNSSGGFFIIFRIIFTFFYISYNILLISLSWYAILSIWKKNDKISIFEEEDLIISQLENLRKRQKKAEKHNNY